MLVKNFTDCLTVNFRVINLRAQMVKCPTNFPPAAVLAAMRAADVEVKDGNATVNFTFEVK